VIFAVPPGVEVLDLAGPLQVFDEARRLGAPFEVLLCGAEPAVQSDQGLFIARLAPLPEPGSEDLVLVPGLPHAALDQVDEALPAFARRAWQAGARVASVCVGAFVLGRAGLLDDRECTTHWSRVADLRREHPRARVLEDRLFVEDGRLVTSAGIASGIDLALSLVERESGPRLTAAVARELVVYLRRDGRQGQSSVYLEHRAHLHPGVHRVQDWIVAHPERRATLPELARIAAVSPRHLTRLFRERAGLTVHEFTTRVRLERARALLDDPDRTLESIATRCGFEDARQFRRLWKAVHGRPPSAARGTVSHR
jgi:transcriptional regulator GlxA family with amidase domain